VLNRVGIYCESETRSGRFRASPRYTRSIAAPRATHGNSSCSFWSRRSQFILQLLTFTSIRSCARCPQSSGCSRMRLGMFA
jgi:hypothetical protein